MAADREDENPGRNEMQLTSDRHTRFGDEISIVPGWAWGLAAASFAVMQYVMYAIVAREPDAPPLWGRILLGLVAGVVVGCYFLLLGYVNQDAGRRGMSRVLWTVVSILFPIHHGLGFVLYFILRQPILGVCPNCASPVISGFNFCPKCNCRLSPSCPQCQHIVHGDDTYCANCGVALTPQDFSVPHVQSGIQS
jgi:hypothetical protein